MLGKWSEETVYTGLQQRGRSVLAAQGHGQGVAPGGPGGSVGGRLPAGVRRGRDGLAGLGEVPRGLVVRGGGPHRRVGRCTCLYRRGPWGTGVVLRATTG